MADRNVLEIAAASIRVLDREGAGSVDRVSFHIGRPSRVVVGSDEGATLRIERADVAPRQLDAIWDGGQLWLQDALRLGRTFVNGRTLNEWIPVVRHALVCFGGVRIWMSSRKPSPPLHNAPDFAALERARQIEAHHHARVRLSDTGRITLTPELLAALNEQGAP
ncbi:MAG TPA: FHA domain-containing protein [Polyangiales bacterium]